MCSDPEVQRSSLYRSINKPYMILVSILNRATRLVTLRVSWVIRQQNLVAIKNLKFFLSFLNTHTCVRKVIN